MSLIDVSEEQIDQLADRYFKEGMAVGLKTGEADLVTATEIITEWYALENKAPPEIVRMPSPDAAEKEARKRLGKKEYVGTWFWGAQEVRWVWWHLAGATLVEHDPEDLKLLKQYERMCRAADWCYFLPGVALVCDHPEEIHLNETPSGPMLHREGGKAIRYRDGWGVSSLWDVSVPDWLAETPAAQLDPVKVMELKNVDQRRQGIRRMGIARVLKELGAKVVVADEIETEVLDVAGMPTGGVESHAYELLSLVLPGTEAASRALKMIYPSGPSKGQALVEFVPPWIETPKEARAWRAMADVKDRKAFERLFPLYGDPVRLT